MNTRLHAEAMPDADPAALADPAQVAGRILRLVADERVVASGGRVAVASLPVAAEGAS